MEALRTFLCFEMGFWLAALMAMVLYRMLTGKINTAGLLLDKQTRRLSPGRVQLLTFTAVSALYYILQVVEKPTELPKPPEEFLLVLGGSNVIYLGGKASSLLSLLFHR